MLLVEGLLAVTPIAREPHLIEKLRLVLPGLLPLTLNTFDSAMHATSLLLVVLKLWRQWHAPRR